ncbi:D-TA family PLP-dependent enzyme [Mesorhizobium sp. NBSH29]|nr:alanine racemase [Mesorhizobium sp. NBSH29]QPC88720.1 D-TA family PLP-dependent enzyme [Mesorhizobium sp. NBSH29]
MADIETPTPVVDLDRVDRNLRTMQDYCDRHGIALRPHIKTHKIPAFAQRQLALGAQGITCQKLTEAEIMADAGIDDILISYPLVGQGKAARLAALAPRCRMTVAVDNPLALATAADAARISGATIAVYVEFDSGMERTGVVSVAEALALAQQLQSCEGLAFAGLMTYPASQKTVGFVAEAKKHFADAGLDIPRISGGGTPKAFHTHELGCIDELRVGTYIYNDRATIGSGAVSLEDCALHVLATVISRPTPERAVIDCGSKTLTSDPAGSGITGFGAIIGYPDAIITRISEEHGVVDLSACAERPTFGDRLTIVPNHVCPVANLHDRITLARGDNVVGELAVSARGMTR